MKIMSWRRFLTFVAIVLLLAITMLKACQNKQFSTIEQTNYEIQESTKEEV